MHSMLHTPYITRCAGNRDATNAVMREDLFWNCYNDTAEDMLSQILGQQMMQWVAKPLFAVSATTNTIYCTNCARKHLWQIDCPCIRSYTSTTDTLEPA